MRFTPFLLLIPLLYLLTFHGLGERELWSSHEGRAAQDAQTLLDGGDWRLPRLFDGRPELQKPPLYYWLTACFGWMRGGVDEVAVRLPSAIGAILAGAAIMVLLSSSWKNCSLSVLAPLMLWTMIHFTWMSRVGRIDMPLTAACAWCIVSFVRAHLATNRSQDALRILGYLCLAAGLMLKGPIALVLAGIVIGPVLLYHAWRDNTSLRSDLFSLLWGLPLVALLVVPWAWWVNHVTEGRFVQEFFIKHNLQRGFGGDDQLDGHIHPWWFYMARFWLDTAPWSLLLPVALYSWWRMKCKPLLPLLGLWWFVSIFVLLSMLQYKRADYLLPAYPGLALFLGWIVVQWSESWATIRWHRTQKWGFALVASLACGWYGYVEFLLPRLESERQLRPFAHLVRQHLPSPGQVIVFRVESHHLNWELGKKTERIWEWENLGWWATRPMPVYVIMPARYAAECASELPEGQLYPLARTTDGCPDHDTPLVLFVNDRTIAAAADR
jgi:4-amino-4-deoxy-L-arabinose transferase-like glycosyltransferase